MKSIFYIALLAVGCGAAEAMIREYIFINTPSTWFNAQAYCRKNYKDLATVTNRDEYNQLSLSTPLSPGSWTGIKRIEGTWKWSDGEPLSFPNWFTNSSFSAISMADCAVTSFDKLGFSENYNCYKLRNFFCYRFLMLEMEKKTWEEAQEFCQTNNSGLASATSETLKLQAAQVQTENVWIGLHFVNGIWMWVSGEPLGNLVSMATNCPAVPYRCGSLNTTSHSVINQNCNDKLNFICM